MTTPRAACPETARRSGYASGMVFDLAARYAEVRAHTVLLAAPLSPEDAQLQSMPEASPAKWHLAHTSWFFSRFVLGAGPLAAGAARLRSVPEASPARWHLALTSWFFSRLVVGEAPGAMPDGWDYLFNSYYVGAAARHARARRGLVSRPALAEVLA